MLKKIFRKLIKSRLDEDASLREFPRYTPTTANLLGNTIRIPDAASYLFTKEEIFNKEIYKFNSSNIAPVIIDGGANIGLATIYLKRLYPNAIIHSFEPDQTICNHYLRHNIEKFGYQNISIHQTGLWHEDATLEFKEERADGGRISLLDGKTDDTPIIRIQVQSITKFLEQPVSFLKLDIEGAEYMVLQSCQQELKNVANIFVEYHSFIGQEQFLPELLAILKRAGFRLNINTPGLSSQQPLIQRNTYAGMDMQLNIYGFRE